MFATLLRADETAMSIAREQRAVVKWPSALDARKRNRITNRTVFLETCRPSLDQPRRTVVEGTGTTAPFYFSNLHFFAKFYPHSTPTVTQIRIRKFLWMADSRSRSHAEADRLNDR